MYRHGPSYLKGPTSRTRAGWRRGENKTDEQRSDEEIAYLTESGEGIRYDLVERVRQEIAAGTYDTPEKWELALDRMADQLDLR